MEHPTIHRKRFWIISAAAGAVTAVLLAIVLLHFILPRHPADRQNLLGPMPDGVKDPSVENLSANLREDFLAHLGVENLEALAGKKLTRRMDEETRQQLKSLGYIE